MKKYFDVSGIRAADVRETVSDVLSDLTLEPLAIRTLARRRSSPHDSLFFYVTDLRGLRSRAVWAQLAAAQPRQLVVFGLLRTAADRSVLVEPDISIRLSEGRVVLLEMQQSGRSALSRAQVAGYFQRFLERRADPATVVSAQFAEGDDVLWVVFADGLRRAIFWRDLPFAVQRPDVLPHTVRVSDHGEALVFSTKNGSEFDMDAAALRAHFDPRQRSALERVAESSAIRLGVRLREAREKRGITQEELASKSSIPQPSLSRIETGRRTPRLDTLEKYAGALGLALPDLLGELRAASTHMLAATTPRSGKAARSFQSKASALHGPR